MTTNNLPALGTLWGQLSLVDRARLPAGTTLGPVPGYKWALVHSIKKDVSGLWVSEFGDVSSPHAGRPILSYPPEVVAAPVDGFVRGASEEPPTSIDKIPPRPWMASVRDLRAASARYIGYVCAGGTREEDQAIAAYIVKAVNAYDAKAIDRAQVALSTAEAEREEAICARDVAQGERDAAFSRIRELEEVTRAKVAERDEANALAAKAFRERDAQAQRADLLGGRVRELERERSTYRADAAYLHRTVDELRRSLLTAEHDRDRAVAVVKEQDAEAKLAARVAALEAQVGRVRFVASSIGYVERLGPHEPGYCALPEGWEWSGRWYPAGLGVTPEGVTTNCWRRNIQRVVP